MSKTFMEKATEGLEVGSPEHPADYPLGLAEERDLVPEKDRHLYPCDTCKLEKECEWAWDEYNLNEADCPCLASNLVVELAKQLRK